MEVSELSELERRLVDAAINGALVDLTTGDSTLDDPSAGSNWDDARTVRAVVLVDLLVGELPAGPRVARAVHLKGAHVVGELDLDGATLVCPLGVEGCHFDGPILLNEAQAQSIRVIKCHVGGIVADQLHTRGDVDLTDTVVTGPGAQLSAARIGGYLNVTGARLINPDGFALDASRIVVEHNMDCRNGFSTQGELQLLGAHIHGSLSFSGANLSNPDGYALSADRLTVDHHANFRDGFTADGQVRLLHATIGGDLDFTGASLRNMGGIALNADGLIVHHSVRCLDGFSAQGEVRLTGGTIGGQLGFDGAELSNPDGVALLADGLTVSSDAYCRYGFTARGEVSLTDARIRGALEFHEASLVSTSGVALNLSGAEVRNLFLLPQESPEGVVILTNANVEAYVDEEATWPAEMDLRGLVYESLEDDPVDVRARLRWLELHEGYVPGAYDQLAAAYRRSGHAEAARLVGIAKQWRRRRQLTTAGKTWNWLLYLTVGYGYRTWLAGLWLLGLLAASAWVFSAAHPAQIVPSSSSVPDFQPVAYALDLLLPIVDLGQERAWIAHGPAQVLSWILIGAGWVLTTAVVAGLTNALKRD